MKTFNFRKIIFINVLIALIFMFSGVHKYEAFAAEGCTAGQVVDYLAELTNLGTLEDNSFEGKKQGLNKFGIEGLEYLASSEDKVTVEKLSSVCVDIMRFIGEDKARVLKDDGSNYQVVDKKGKVLYSDGKWIPYVQLDYDKRVKLEDEIIERNRIKNYERIADLDVASSEYKWSLVTVLRKGIMIGKSLGKYSQKRNIEPKRLVSLKEVKKAIDRTYNMDKRYPMSPDGQLIRKTNLPVNASEYKYILAAYPNSFYETRFEYENYPSSYKKIHEDYDKPKFIYEFINYNHQSDLGIFEKAEKIRNFQNLRMNIDYKKLDKKWRDKIVSFYKDDHEIKDLTGIKKEINEYIKFVKKNKIIVESEPATTEASAMYDNGEGYCAHEHMKYRIVSCKNLDKNLEKIIYGAKINNKGWGITKHYKEKVKLGKWIEGIYCITYPKANFQNYFVDDYPWKMIKPCLINNATRNLKKNKILKQFKITPKDKLWYNPEIDWILYGWK